MKKNTKILTILVYAVLLAAVATLLNDINDFNFMQFQEFQSWSASSNKSEHWFTSKNAMLWSTYALSFGFFFWRAYLLYGFTYFISILKEIEKEHYFSEKNISYFKKIGTIFITYTINVLALRFLQALIEQSSFNLLREFKNELTFLIPCGLAFYLLSELFKRAKTLQEENDLTI